MKKEEETEERLQKASRVPGLRLSRVERDAVSIGAVHTSMYRCDARRHRTSLTQHRDDLMRSAPAAADSSSFYSSLPVSTYARARAGKAGALLYARTILKRTIRRRRGRRTDSTPAAAAAAPGICALVTEESRCCCGGIIRQSCQEEPGLQSRRRAVQCLLHGYLRARERIACESLRHAGVVPTPHRRSS